MYAVQYTLYTALYICTAAHLWLPPPCRQLQMWAWTVLLPYSDRPGVIGVVCRKKPAVNHLEPGNVLEVVRQDRQTVTGGHEESILKPCSRMH